MNGHEGALSILGALDLSENKPTAKRVTLSLIAPIVADAFIEARFVTKSRLVGS
jgi:hypothetical protein